MVSFDMFIMNQRVVLSCPNLATHTHQTLSILTYVDPIYYYNVVCHYTNASLGWSSSFISCHDLILYDIQVSVLQMENNQASGDQSVGKTTHYDITMGNYVVRDAYSYITIHCDVTIGNDIAMNLFYYGSLCLFVLFIMGSME